MPRWLKRRRSAVMAAARVLAGSFTGTALGGRGRMVQEATVRRRVEDLCAAVARYNVGERDWVSGVMGLRDPQTQTRPSTRATTRAEVRAETRAETPQPTQLLLHESPPTPPTPLTPPTPTALPALPALRLVPVEMPSLVEESSASTDELPPWPKPPEGLTPTSREAFRQIVVPQRNRYRLLCSEIDAVPRYQAASERYLQQSAEYR
ncbi:MAG: hypothetical protein K2Q20_01660, partial [Phycisphaerales bacterium]|nr:hypothetical protein [Phycisphaerales bacterium]